jgi:hypothetical protein
VGADCSAVALGDGRCPAEVVGAADPVPVGFHRSTADVGRHLMSLYKSQSVLSTEPYRAAIKATVAGVVINLSADVVQFAFMSTTANPATSDWKTGAWEVLPGPIYVAYCQVGPAAGGVPYAVGNYTAWVKVVDNPDVPVQAVGTLQIT